MNWQRVWEWISEQGPATVAMYRRAVAARVQTCPVCLGALEVQEVFAGNESERQPPENDYRPCPLCCEEYAPVPDALKAEPF